MSRTYRGADKKTMKAKSTLVQSWKGGFREANTIGDDDLLPAPHRMYDIYTKKGVKTTRPEGDLGSYPQAKYRTNNP